MINEFERRINIANNLSESLRDQDNCLGILVVGSTALEEAMANSDLDIMIFRRGLDEPFEEQMVIDDVKVGLEYYPDEYFDYFLDKDFYSLGDLRILGRLITGKLIFEREESISKKINAFSSVNISKKPLLVLLKEYIVHRENSFLFLNKLDFVKSVIELRTSAESLAIALLSLTPPWYKQPKWTLDDLTKRGHKEFYDAFVAILALSETKIEESTIKYFDDLIEIVYEFFVEASSTEQHQNDKTKYYLSKKYRDTSRDFLKRGDKYQSAYCLRVAVDLILSLSSNHEVDKLQVIQKISQSNANDTDIYTEYKKLYCLTECDENYFKKLLPELDICFNYFISKARNIYPDLL